MIPTSFATWSSYDYNSNTRDTYNPWNSRTTYVSIERPTQVDEEDVAKNIPYGTWLEFDQDLKLVLGDKRDPICLRKRDLVYNHHVGRDRPWTGKNYCKQRD